MGESRSIVEYFYKDDADRSGSRCGYCHSSDTGYSQGMWGHVISCQDYQDLIDRGWRRSGIYLYKSLMKKTCCPLYTIRCDAVDFQPSKSHKKVIKKVTKFLKDGHTVAVPESQESATTSESARCQWTEEPTKKEPGENQKEKATSAGPDPNKPPCQKAKLMRKERKSQKLASKGILKPEQPKQNAELAKTLEELLAAHLPSQESTHKLECVLVKCDMDIPEFQSTYRQSFELFCKYQKEVHKDKPEKLNERRVKLVRVDLESEEFKATLTESHNVFAKYQMNVHKDSPSECGFNQFKRFLVESPLTFVKNESTPSTGCGSFHEQFYIDGKLIAVGVLDILPYCVSSVYFFYDTDYSFLSLGVYSALRELEFTRELNKTSSQLRYYYMGFYVHSCQKMSYKASYIPSYLVCPESYSWIPIEKCLPKLEVSRYARLDETDKEDPAVEISTVLVLAPTHGGLMLYNTYKLLCGTVDENEIREYAQLIGPKVAPRMALFRG